MPSPDQLHEINLKRLEHEYESERQRVEFVQQFAHSALKLIVLLNGGALVALFTLLGNLEKPAVDALAMDESALKSAFGFFVAGLLAAFAAHFLAYITQEFLTAGYVFNAEVTYASLRDGEDHPRASRKFFVTGTLVSLVAILGVVGSVGCFALGSFEALKASQPSRGSPEVQRSAETR